MNHLAVDTFTDVPVVCLAWVPSHPTLRGIPLDPVPAAAVALRAANGEATNVVGFIDYSITLIEITRTVIALAVPAFGPDIRVSYLTSERA